MTTTSKATGRPSLLTDDVRRKVLGALRVGCTRTAAAGFAGISPRTLRSWLAKPADTPDESDVEGAVDDERDPFADFRAEVEAAEALCQARLSGSIFQAALSDPKAAQWLLERRFPAEWSKAAAERAALDQHERDARDERLEGVVAWGDIDVRTLSDEQLERVARGEPPGPGDPRRSRSGT